MGMKMRKTRIIAVITAAMLIAAAALMSSCGKENGDAPDGYVKISADGIGYSFYAPETWIATEQSGVTGAKASDFDSSNVSMMGFDAGDANSAQDYWDAYSKDYTRIFGDFSYEDEGSDTVIGGRDAKKYIYTVKLSDKDYKIMQIVCYCANTSLFTSQPEVYVFTYTAQADKYDEHIEEVLLMADSVVFD